MTIYIGIDGGGSTCRALIQDVAGNTLGHGLGGPANPVDGIEQAQASILTACRNALKEAGLRESALGTAVVGAGLAGLHLPAMHQAMLNWSHPFAQLHLTTDLHAAVLGAHQGRDGGVLILGTGFSALGVCQGEQLALGGLGFPVNAMGSGSWLGLEAVKAVLLAADDLGPQTLLSDKLLENRSKLELAQLTINADAATFGQFAIAVFDAAADGDLVGGELIRQASQFAQLVIKRMHDFGAPLISLTGSVAHALVTYFNPDVQALISDPQATPQAGAILFAKQHN